MNPEFPVQNGPFKNILATNIEALARLNPGLAEALHSTTAPTGALELSPSRQNVFSGQYRGQWLASRHRPLHEAERFAARFNPVEKAVVAILGFGLGHHVKATAERLKGTGFVIVFEPDLGLLRAVFERIDCSDWLGEHDVFFFTDPDNRPEINARLDSRIAVVAQGTAILEHPPSRRRLAESATVFSKNVADAVAAMRTTLVTTLVHAVTTCRNLCLNLGQYAAGSGIADLQGWAKERAAILVAAGPSLARNVDLLRDPVVREHCVIIAVQTALKPLLARGIQPHFVTALDYHEISRQFYEGLKSTDVEGITLVCEPKANRSILEGYPGPIRCVGNTFLDRLLGPMRRDMGAIKPGATVAHLNFYLAQYLGCDPIVFIGQDLGFSEGLYYGPGAAIHEQWAPELNSFNTLEMMEWQRVVRMKAHLRETTDVNGRPILIDEQMATYLKIFESEFSNAPQRIIDASEGGTAKKHTVVEPLRKVLNEVLHPQKLPVVASLNSKLEESRIRNARERVRSVRQEIVRLRELSRETSALLDRMLEHQTDERIMDECFEKINANRDEVNRMTDAMELVGSLNQIGVFNRLRADRALRLADELDELTRQRRQVERDKVNVQWIGDACDEFLAILDESDQVLRGQYVDPRISRPVKAPTNVASALDTVSGDARMKRVSALIAADPKRNGLLVRRGLDESFLGRSVLQCTLERVNDCGSIDEIILLVPDGFDVGRLLDREALKAKKLHVMRMDAPLYDAQQAAVAAARRWSDASWRGGISGMTVYDEVICPKAMLKAMEQFDLDAALIVGADWPLVDPSAEIGCDAVVKRYREQPEVLNFVFTQAPPGLCGCVVSRKLMSELANRDRRQTLGAILTYIPHLPQRDPITMDMCVKLPAVVRNRTMRFSFDSDSRRRQLCEAFEPLGARAFQLSALEMADRMASINQHDDLPIHLELELTCQRLVNGPITPQSSTEFGRSPIEFELARRVIEQLAERDDATISLRGLGDPLLHPEFGDIVRCIRDAGISAIHVQTDLLEPEHVIDELLHLPIDVISVNLNADRQVTYARAMGADRLSAVITHFERLINKRAALAGEPTALALPWLVPTLVKSTATIDDMRSFFDRWIYFLNAALIEPFPRCSSDSIQFDDELLTLPLPENVCHRDELQKMTIWCDGSVPLDRSDWLGGRSVGNVAENSIRKLWQRVLEERSHRRHAFTYDGEPVDSSASSVRGSQHAERRAVASA